MDQYKFETDPIARPESVVSGHNYRFTFINEYVLRYEWAADGQFEDRASTFAICRRFDTPTFRIVHDSEDHLEIVTPYLHLTYDKQKFSPNGFFVIFKSKLTDWGASWRYGQTWDENNMGGTARTLDCVDGRCDMEMGIISKSGYACLDDSHSMLFEKSGFVAPRRPGERIDGYLFSYGNKYREVMEAFYAISGRSPAVPRWCLGNWWSRYYAYNQQEYLDLMDEFRQNKIPMSVAVIDMDWHWVKEDFVEHTGWTGYTWNRKLFPDPKTFADGLHKRDLKMTLNDHPHSGVHAHEEVYEELATALGHDTTKSKDPIVFDPTSEKFMHAYFNIVHRKLEKQGCDFWWIDWQQGSHSKIVGFDPLWLLNHFEYLDLKQANPDATSIIFSRYAGPGSHRYPVGFSGDTFATWDSLRFQPEFTATASNIGFGWWSHDIGGHLGGIRDDECATRWVQYGVYSPILRLHSTISEWMSKEPWLYRSEFADAMRAAMQFRHRLVPYIYTTMLTSRLPLVQPMYWQYPELKQAYEYPNQYYFGSSLIVAPIVDPRDSRTGMASVNVWLPPGRFIDHATGIVYDGDREITAYRLLKSIPVFLPEGAILPLDAAEEISNGCKNPTAMMVDIVVGHDAEFIVWENPSSDAIVQAANSELPRVVHILYTQRDGRLQCKSGAGKSWQFRFRSLAINRASIRVKIGGKSETSARVDVSNPSDGEQQVTVTIPMLQDGHDDIVIDLGTNPQLAVLSHKADLFKMIRDFQITFKDKDRIWAILQSQQQSSIKASRLLSLGLETPIVGPILERLLADSRTHEAM